MSSPENNADGLADFVRGLPEGQRHKGTFWALNTAIEGGLPEAEIAKVEQAALSIGLPEKYVRSTTAEAKRKG